MKQVYDICQKCGKVYLAGPYSFVCTECRRKAVSDSAKDRNLSQLGHEVRKEESEAK